MSYFDREVAPFLLACIVAGAILPALGVDWRSVAYWIGGSGATFAIFGERH